MLHKKLVLVVGMSRGGTNVVWNILQSHPSLGAPIRELGQELNPIGNNRVRTAIDFILGHPIFLLPPINILAGNWMDERFYQSKMSGLADIYAAQKFENSLYNQEELAQTDLLLKGTDRDMYLMDLLAAVYEQFYVVFVVRNGYALCDSWIRRGNSAEKAGKRYQHYIRYMLEAQKRFPQTKIVKFEEVLADPFGKAEEIFAFAKLEPSSIPKLRVKSKAIVNAAGEVKTTVGGEGGKKWYDRETISQVIVPHQSTLQAERLRPEDHKTFERYTASIMRELGYN